MRRSFSVNRIRLVAVSACWLIVICVGLSSLLNYGSTPGKSLIAGEKWMSTKSLKLASPLATLIMVVHSQCPCSRASMSELAVLMARSQNRVKAYVVFVHSNSNSENAETELWRRAAEIPGVEAVVDDDGRLAERLKALTSGECYLYDANGRLMFKGGITSGRGHEGDNAGVDAIVALIDGDRVVLNSTPVFGCPIFDQCQIAGR